MSEFVQIVCKIIKKYIYLLLENGKNGHVTWKLRYGSKHLLGYLEWKILYITYCI